MALLSSLFFEANSQCQAYYSFNDNSNKVTVHNSKRFSNVSIFDTTSSVKFKWEIDGVIKSTDFAPNINFSKVGDRRVCLILIDSANNCTDSTCGWVEVLPTKKCGLTFNTKDTVDSCHVQFLLDWSNSTGGVDSFHYDFGDRSGKMYGSTQSVLREYSKTGEYKVKLTTYGMSGTCVSTYERTIYITGCKGVSLCTGLIGGKNYLDYSSLADNVNFPAGKNHKWDATTYLIQKAGPILSVVDSFSCDTCNYYSFNKLCPDTYYVKTALRTTDTHYANFLPSYSPRFLRWDSVYSPSIIGNGNYYSNRDIYMVKGTNPGGPGFVSGNVSQGANKKAGEPLGNIQITLLDGNDQPVAYTYSKKDGSFVVDDIPYGSYFLFAEVPGAESDGINFNLTKDEPKLEDVKVEVDPEHVVTSITRTQVYERSPISVYPNPAQGEFTINTNGIDGNLRVTDITGKLVFSRTVIDQDLLQFNLTETGTYILNFTSVEGSSYSKVLFKQ